MNKCLKYKLLDNILWVSSMFKPKALYCENNIENYALGRELLEKYADVPRVMIDNHNNIEEMRKLRTIGIATTQPPLTKTAMYFATR